jgi:hypothetical protein
MKAAMKTAKHRHHSGASVKRRSVLHLCKSVARKTGIRWVSAPQSLLSGVPAIQGVMVAANEDVQWSWTHMTNGSYVSGYSIVSRLTPRAVILNKATNLSRADGPKKRPGSFASLKVISQKVGG